MTIKFCNRNGKVSRKSNVDINEMKIGFTPRQVTSKNRHDHKPSKSDFVRISKSYSKDR